MPQKFLFIDLEGLSPSVIGRLNDRMCVSILLSAASRELERLVSPTAIRLGCTPVVNLFPHRLDPLRITGTRSEYCLVPDVRRPRSLEIYTIDSVRGSTPGGKPFSVLPFYSPSTVAAGNVAPAPGTAIPMRWSAMRRRWFDTVWVASPTASQISVTDASPARAMAWRMRSRVSLARTRNSAASWSTSGASMSGRSASAGGTNCWTVRVGLGLDTVAPLLHDSV
jgi:hypothetical protein